MTVDLSNSPFGGSNHANPATKSGLSGVTYATAEKPAASGGFCASAVLRYARDATAVRNFYGRSLVCI